MATAEAMSGDRPGQERSDNGPGIVLVWCPAGSFRMGSDDIYDTWTGTFVTADVVAAHRPPSEPRGEDEDDGEDDDEDEDGEAMSRWGRFGDETPVDVILRHGFWIGRYPVTQAEFEAVMGPGSQYSQFRDREDAARRPVERVAWDDAVMFCRELTGLETAAGRLPEGWAYRLPTEAQWEYACRAGTLTRYYTGESEQDLQRAAFFRAKSSRYDLEARKHEQTHAVGQMEPNTWGLCDTLGNVNEWCRDVYNTDLPGGPDPFAAPTRGDEERVVRGGNYKAEDYECRASRRRSWCPDTRFATVGFRVALLRLTEDEPIDTRERSAESPIFTRRKAAVEGRPIPRPPETHDELRARADAFLGRPNPSGKSIIFYDMADAFLRSYLAGESQSDNTPARPFLVLAISSTVGDLKNLYGDAEDHMLERAALYRGLYQLVYGEDPDDYQHPDDVDEAGE